jgi:hypothetical protein
VARESPLCIPSAASQRQELVDIRSAREMSAPSTKDDGVRESIAKSVNSIPQGIEGDQGQRVARRARQNQMGHGADALHGNTGFGHGCSSQAASAVAVQRE